MSNNATCEAFTMVPARSTVFCPPNVLAEYRFADASKSHPNMAFICRKQPSAPGRQNISPVILNVSQVDDAFDLQCVAIDDDDLPVDCSEQDAVTAQQAIMRTLARERDPLTGTVQ